MNANSLLSNEGLPHFTKFSNDDVEPGVSTILSNLENDFNNLEERIKKGVTNKFKVPFISAKFKIYNLDNRSKVNIRIKIEIKIIFLLKIFLIINI